MIAYNIGTWEIPEWVELAFGSGGGGGGLPIISSGDAGKVVSVKSDLTGYELVATGSSISAYVKSTDLSTTNKIKFKDKNDNETVFEVDFSGYQTEIKSTNKLSFTLLKDVPTTISGYGITDAYDKTTIDTKIQTVTEIAQGRTRTIVISKVTNPSFNSSNADVTATTITDINGNPYGKDDLKLGDQICIKETDAPDRWVSNIVAATGVITFTALEISKTILTGYVTETDLTTKLTEYQTKITEENKLKWSLIKETPTTLEGYGITDAYKKTECDETFFKVAKLVKEDFQATPDDEHVITEKLAFDELLKKQVNLNVKDDYIDLQNNGDIKLKNVPTKKGQSISCEYDTNEKMKTNYGGTYWRLISYDPITNIRVWKRTDDSPILVCYEGMTIKNTGLLDTIDKVKAAYGGVNWNLLGVSGSTYEWECTDNTGYTPTKQPCNIGDVISGFDLPNEAAVIAKYNAEGFTLIGSYTVDGKTRYEWECTTCASPATFRPSIVGMHYKSKTLTTVAEVKALFDSAEVTTTWELLGNYGTKFEFRRIS